MNWLIPLLSLKYSHQIHESLATFQNLALPFLYDHLTIMLGQFRSSSSCQSNKKKDKLDWAELLKDEIERLQLERTRMKFL